MKVARTVLRRGGGSNPFSLFDCNDPEVGGKEVISRKGVPVWSCKECHFLHTKEVSEYVHQRLRASGYDEDTDLDSLFCEIKSMFLHLYSGCRF